MSHALRDTPRKLQPPITQRDIKAEVAHCVGGENSPVLANLFMHHAFDSWLEREFPIVEFERQTDDGVVHCVTERQAGKVLATLETRMEQVALQLHPTKTKIVYGKDRTRVPRL